MDEITKKPLEVGFNQDEITAFKGLTADETAQFAPIADFLSELVDEQTDPWIGKAFVRGKWWFEFKDGVLQVAYNPELITSQQRDRIVVQVFDAIDRTPNRFIDMVKEH